MQHSIVCMIRKTGIGLAAQKEGLYITTLDTLARTLGRIINQCKYEVTRAVERTNISLDTIKEPSENLNIWDIIATMPDRK